tara:strand:+ start:244 stop:570 length:327 start_codon:yes stop_codon:yes gene_type:complete
MSTVQVNRHREIARVGDTLYRGGLILEITAIGRDFILGIRTGFTREKAFPIAMLMHWSLDKPNEVELLKTRVDDLEREVSHYKREREVSQYKREREVSQYKRMLNNRW